MTISILYGDCRDMLKTLPDESVHCVVTSPPYWGLRDYNVAGQIGLEPDFNDYIAAMVGVFREVRRVLRSDGTLWLNLGDSYAGGGGSFEGERNWRAGNPEKNKGNSNRDGLGRVSGLKPKDLCGMPWRVAFALQADGWWLRQDIIWSKPNPMPESVTDRCTKAHEYLFLLSKNARYYYDAEAIKEPALMNCGPWGGRGDAKRDPEVRTDLPELAWQQNGSRNKRSVWEIATAPFSEAHFATFPPALIEPCIKAGCPVGGTVLDPFGGAGTTGLVADRLQRDAILIELNPEYAAMADRRINADLPLFVKTRGGVPNEHNASNGMPNSG